MDDKIADSAAPGPAIGPFDPLAALTRAHRVALDAAAESFRSFDPRIYDARADPAAEPVAGDAESIETDLPGGSSDDRMGMGDLRRTVRRTLDMYLELAEQFFEASTRSFEATLRSRGVSVTGHADASMVPLRVAGHAGEVLTEQIWVHNQTPDPLVAARFRVSDLYGHREALIPAARVRVHPSIVDTLEPGASASATLNVAVDDTSAPGVYVGYVLLSPVDDAVLPIRLEVTTSVNGDRAEGLGSGDGPGGR